MVTLIKRLAQWVLKEELEAANEFTQTVMSRYEDAVESEHQMEDKLYETRHRLEDYMNRADALTDWFSNSDYLRNNNLIRFSVDYIQYGAMGDPTGTAGVHPAMRWGIPGSQGWEHAHGCE